MIPASLRGRLVRLAMILSICLNAAFIAGWMMHAFPLHRQFHDRFSMMPVHSGTVPALYRDLGLAPEQWKRLEVRVQAFREKAAIRQETVQAAQKRMIGLLEADPVNDAAILTTRKEIIEGKERLHGLVIEHILALKSELSPDQQRKLFSLLRRKCLVSPSPGDLSGSEGRPPLPGSSS